MKRLELDGTEIYFSGANKRDYVGSVGFRLEFDDNYEDKLEKLMKSGNGEIRKDNALSVINSQEKMVNLIDFAETVPQKDISPENVAELTKLFSKTYTLGEHSFEIHLKEAIHTTDFYKENLKEKMEEVSKMVFTDMQKSIEHLTRVAPAKDKIGNLMKIINQSEQETKDSSSSKKLK